jgi:stage III sporulation protein AB
MIKILGIVIMVCSSIGIGRSYSRGLTKNVEQLKKMKKMIYILKSEIKYSKAPLPEAFENLSERVEEPLRSFLSSVSAKLNQLSGRTFREIWEEEVEDKLQDSYLTKEDKEQLKRMGESMGYLDSEMQDNTLELYLEQLEISIEESRQTAAVKSKVYNCLGVTIGLFLAIILI